MAADHTPSNAWREAALAFELRAMRVEYAIRLLVAAGHVTQEKVDEAFAIAKGFDRTSIGDTPAPQSKDGGESSVSGDSEDGGGL